MATTTTHIGPIAEQQINTTYYVGAGGFSSTQAAVDFINTQDGVGRIVIMHGYANPGDIISDVTGGDFAITIYDERDGWNQNYVWNGANYVPRDTRQNQGYITYGMPVTDASYLPDDPRGLTLIGFDTTDENGTGNLIVKANPDEGMPAFNLTLIPQDGTDAQQFIRCDLDPATSLPRTIINEDLLMAGNLTANGASFAAPVAATCYIATDLISIGFPDSSALLDEDAANNTARLSSRSNGALLGSIELNGVDSTGRLYSYLNFGESSPGERSATCNAALTVYGTLTVEGDEEITGSLMLSGDPTAPLEAATKQYVDAHAGGGMVYPAAGVPQSTGTAWGASIPAANLARTNAANTFAAAQTFGSTVTLNADPAQPLQAATKQYVDGKAGGGMVYPAAGVAVSTGGAWGTAIDPATLPRLNVANTFTASGIFNGSGVNLNVINTTSDTLVLQTTGTTASAAIDFFTPSHAVQMGFGSAGNAGNPNAFYVWDNTNGTSLWSLQSGTGDMYVKGVVSAAAKNFVIPYPLVKGGDGDPLRILTHSCLEGPEMAVYYRGVVETSNGVALVTLPDYFEALTLDENRSVLLTQVYDEDEAEPEFAMLMSSQVRGGQFTVRSSIPVATVAWEVKAVRADQPPLVVVGPAPMKPVQTMVPPPQPQSEAEPPAEAKKTAAAEALRRRRSSAD